MLYQTHWLRSLLLYAEARQRPEIIMNPEKIADAFYYLHTQDRSCWTHEIQLSAYSRAITV